MRNGLANISFYNSFKVYYTKAKLNSSLILKPPRKVANFFKHNESFVVVAADGAAAIRAYCFDDVDIDIWNYVQIIAL